MNPSDERAATTGGRAPGGKPVAGGPVAGGPDGTPPRTGTDPTGSDGHEVAATTADGGAPTDHGRFIRRASLGGTALFVVSAGLAALVGRGPLLVVAALVAVVLFVLGSVAYLVGYARAVRRSRTEVIAMSGLVFLRECAPVTVRRQLIGSTVVQVVVALAAASVRPFTLLAFGVLAPVYGLGLGSLWAARHGRFPARRPRPPRAVPSPRTSVPSGRSPGRPRRAPRR